MRDEEPAGEEKREKGK